MQCKHLAVAAYELRRYWQMFVVFLLVCVLLISVTISVFQLARQLPEQISDDYEQFMADDILVSGIYPDELDWIFAQNMEISSLDCSVYLGLNVFGLTEDDLPDADTSAFYRFSGEVAMDVGHKETTNQLAMQDQLIAGSAADTPGENAIWMLQPVADLLGYHVGDSVPLFDENDKVCTSSTLAGIYSFSEAEKFPAFFVSMACAQALTPPDNLLRFNVYGTPPSYQDYMRVIRVLQKNLYGVSYSSMETLRAYTLLIYALYALCGVLTLCTISVCYNMLRLYFERRLSFFSMQRALGMTRLDLFFMMLWVSTGVMLAAFLCSMGLVPAMLDYVITYINQLFDEMELTRTLSPGSVLSVLGLCLLIPLTACLLEYRALRNINPADILGKV